MARRSSPKLGPIPGAIACTSAFLLYTYGALVADDRTIFSLLFAALVMAAAPFVIARLARHETSFDLAGIMYLGFGLKLCATHFRFRTGVDAGVYNRVGRIIADHLRDFDVVVDPGRSVPGTGSVRYLTGVVHVLTGSDYFASFLVFSLMGYAGLYFFYRAFAAGLSEGRHRRYAWLVFCWPTLLYWPSSIGKEAPMVASLGLASWGAARLLSRYRGGLLMLLAGMLGSAMVRPHVTLIVVAAVLVALVLRSPVGDSMVSTMSKVLAVGILVFAASLAVSATEEALGIDDITSGFDQAADRTSQGGSEFDANKVDSPLEMPRATVTVLFRPFPTEANTAEALASALEGLVLLAMLVVSLPALARSLLHIRQRAYVAYCLVYVVVFVYLFSVIANFGILTRQRSQVMPLVLVLVALPPKRPNRRRRAARSRARSAAPR